MREGGGIEVRGTHLLKNTLHGNTDEAFRVVGRSRGEGVG